MPRRILSGTICKATNKKTVVEKLRELLNIRFIKNILKGLKNIMPMMKQMPLKLGIKL